MAHSGQEVIREKNSAVYRNGSGDSALILRVDTPFRQISVSLAELVLNVSRRSGCSLEWITDSRCNRRRVWLILRRSGRGNDTETETMMNRAAEILQRGMAEEDICLTVLPAEDSAMVRMGLQTRENRMLCVPAEHLRECEFCYVPGGYDQIPPMDLAALDGMITQNSDAGMSVLIDPARYTEKEFQLLKKNLAWLNAQDDTDPVRRASRVYRLYLAMAMDPLYTALLTIWGSRESLSVIRKFMADYGYDMTGIPEAVMEEEDPVLTEYRRLENYAFCRGHVLSKGTTLLNGAERWNYLASAETIVKNAGTLCNGSRKPLKTSAEELISPQGTSPETMIPPHGTFTEESVPPLKAEEDVRTEETSKSGGPEDKADAVHMSTDPAAGQKDAGGIDMTIQFTIHRKGGKE